MIWREKGNIKMDAGELDRMGDGWNYFRLVYISVLWCQPPSTFDFRQHGVRYMNQVTENCLKQTIRLIFASTTVVNSTTAIEMLVLVGCYAG
jgi:hypothetical protein